MNLSELAASKGVPKELLEAFQPRRPFHIFDDDASAGYMESDRDFAENNLELAVALLEVIENESSSNR
jgi:hypothetical protein